MSVGLHMGFVGVTTGGSSIMQVFPAWADLLGLPTRLLIGYDVPLDAPRATYRDLVARLKADPDHAGSLVTTHKMALYEAAADLFDELDPYALRYGEISSISKRNGALVGHAKDPISSHIAIGDFVAVDHFATTGGAAICFGVGGAGGAISADLGGRDDLPSAIVCTDTSQDRLDHAAAIHAAASTPAHYRYELVTAQADNDRLLAEAPAGTLVVNATGLGKDRPGSPISDAARFPLDALAWELNYRGGLDFLHQAERQRDERGVTGVDGWRYFIHGWTQVIAEVFQLDLDPELLDRLSAAADSVRR